MQLWQSSPLKDLESMRSANRALGGLKPTDLLDTRQGAEMLLQLLGQIEHGVYR